MMVSRARAFRVPKAFALVLLFVVVSWNPENPNASSGNPVAREDMSPAISNISLRLPLNESDLSSSVRRLTSAAESEGYSRVSSMNFYNNNIFEFTWDGFNHFYNLSDYIVEFMEFDELAYLERYPEVQEGVHAGVFQSGFDHYTELPFVIGPYSYHFEGGSSNQGADSTSGSKAFSAPLKPGPFFGDARDVYGFIYMKNPEHVENGYFPFCGRIAYEDDFFVLFSCTRLEVHRHLAEHFSWINFRPMKWMRPRAIYPEDFKFF
jgi:hypothetical protein